jgi:hypothetical protein
MLFQADFQYFCEEYQSKYKRRGAQDNEKGQVDCIVEEALAKQSHKCAAHHGHTVKQLKNTEYLPSFLLYLENLTN